MHEESPPQSPFLQAVLDAIPTFVFVVDSDMRIFHLNLAASRWLGLKLEDLRLKPGGEALRCIHSFPVPGGCGRWLSCKDCIVRGSVKEAMQGVPAHRKKTRMQVIRGRETQDLYLAVSASPFEYKSRRFAILILEDIAELVRLQTFLPICTECKRIRSDAQYWESVERYFETRVDVWFTHAMCPDCKRRLYPDLAAE